MLSRRVCKYATEDPKAPRNLRVVKEDGVLVLSRWMHSAGLVFENVEKELLRIDTIAPPNQMRLLIILNVSWKTHTHIRHTPYGFFVSTIGKYLIRRDQQGRQFVAHTSHHSGLISICSPRAKCSSLQQS